MQAQHVFKCHCGEAEENEALIICPGAPGSYTRPWAFHASCLEIEEDEVSGDWLCYRCAPAESSQSASSQQRPPLPTLGAKPLEVR